MVRFNIAGSVMDELCKIGLEKGWIKNAVHSSNIEDLAPPPTGGDVDFGKPIVERKIVPQKTQYQKSSLIQNIQEVMVKYLKNPQLVGKNGPDGVWGPKTARTWNYIANKEGFNAVSPNGSTLPDENLMNWFLEVWTPSKFKQAQPKQVRPEQKQPEQNIMQNKNEQIRDILRNIKEKYKLSDQEAFDQAKAYYPNIFKNISSLNQLSAADDQMVDDTKQKNSIIRAVMRKYNLDYQDAEEYAKQKFPRIFSDKPLPKPYDPWDPKSWGIDNKPLNLPEGEDVLKEVEEKGFKVSKQIVNELVSLANDLDGLGETKSALAVDNQIRIYKEAMDRLYDNLTNETGEQLIERAHPGGGPTIAPSQEEGGKIETIIEEHKKLVDKVTKQPTGKIAETISKLIITANKLEDDGLYEVAKVVDKTIYDLSKRVSDPFVNGSSVFGATNSNDKKVSFIKSAIEPGVPLLQREIGKPIGRGVGKKLPAVPYYLGKATNVGKGLGKIVGAKLATKMLGKSVLALSKVLSGPVGWGLLALDVLKIVSSKFSSISEGISTDLKDILETINNMKSEDKRIPPLANSVITKLSPWIDYFSNPGLDNLEGDVKKIGELMKNVYNFSSDLASSEPQIAEIGRISEEWTIDPRKWSFRDLNEVLIQKYKSLIKSLKEQTDLWKYVYADVIKQLKSQKPTKKNINEKSIEGKVRTAYKFTLKKINSLISNNRNVWKRLGGAENVKNFSEKFNNEINNINNYDLKTVEDRNRAVWNLYQLLKNKTTTSKTSSKNNYFKILYADDFTESIKQLTQKLSPKKQTTKGPKKTKSIGKRLDVEALQNALNKLGYGIYFGSTGVDGRWGKNTANAYKMMAEDYMEKYPKDELPQVTNVYPGPQTIRLALKAMEKMETPTGKISPREDPAQRGKIFYTKEMDDLVKLFNMFPMLGLLQNPSAFKNISIRRGQTPEQYLRYLNGILAQIQVKLAENRSEIETQYGSGEVQRMVREIQIRQKLLDDIADELRVDLFGKQELEKTKPQSYKLNTPVDQPNSVAKPVGQSNSVAKPVGQPNSVAKQTKPLSSDLMNPFE